MVSYVRSFSLCCVYTYLRVVCLHVLFCSCTCTCAQHEERVIEQNPRWATEPQRQSMLNALGKEVQNDDTNDLTFHLKCRESSIPGIIHHSSNQKKRNMGWIVLVLVCHAGTGISNHTSKQKLAV